MKRRIVLQALAALPAAISLPAFSQTTKMMLGYTAVTDFASIFVAAEEGYFKKRNLDIELKFIPINSTIPAAIQSDSLQIGGLTPSVFLQSTDGGLDLVVLAGGGVTSKASTGSGLVARTGSGIRTAQDCIGKKIGVPGLGAFLHVTFRGWLKANGVDYKKVTFVEAAFPQHGDLLRGGSLDAVVSADPFKSRIVDSGVGYVAAYYATYMPDGEPTIVHTAKREWAQKNPAAVKAFREAVQEGAAFMQDERNHDKVRVTLGKYIKLPPDVLAKVYISPPGALVNVQQLGYWITLMQEQDLLKNKPDPVRLLFK